MNTRQCPECKSELQENAVFCTTCGRDLASIHSDRRHRTLLFGTPLSLLIIGIALAWDIGWNEPVDSGSEFGMVLALFYIGGAIGQWLLAILAGREIDAASAWRGGLYTVILLPVALLLSMPIRQHLVGDGYPGISLADEPYLKLGIEFCIYISLLIAGLLGAVTRLPPAPHTAEDGLEVEAAIDRNRTGSDDGVAVLIDKVVQKKAERRAPGMARLIAIALCVAALCMGTLPDSSRLVMQARLASLVGRSDLALTWTGQALEKNPRDAAAHHLRGRLLMARERGPDGREDALAHLRNAVRIAPRVAGYHLTLGMELNRLGLASEAVKAASEAVSLHAGEPQLWMMLGDTLTSSGNRASAVTAYRKALDISPQDPVVMNNLAFMLLELNRDLPLALELARRSVDAQQGYVYNMDTLSWALYKNGRSNEALEIMLQIKESVATPTVEIEFHNAVICREVGLMESPRAVFSRLAGRQDVDAVPGLREQIMSILEALPASDTAPVRAGKSGATGTAELVKSASDATETPDVKGR